MSSILITNIKKLVSTEENPPKWKAGKDMSKLPSLENSFLYIINDKIAEYGTMSNIRAEFQQASKIIDASGKMVFPAFCDSHTHLLYPASREIEYVDKIKGLTYEEIAKRGGGILNTAQKMKQTTVAELVDSALERLDEIKKFGTGAVEIKSGYGLDTEEELKMLYAIRKLKEQSPLTIKATFLGAHSIPAEYRGKQEKYVDIVVNEMIPLVAGEGLADYVDVFCDKGFFTVEDTDRILAAGVKHGLIPKIHANELDYSGGIQVGVKHKALSVDHLEYTGDSEIEALLGSGTMPTILPGAAFFLNMPYAPTRKMIDAGLPVAMASDFNPGSSPSGNMQLILSMASILYKLTPEEAINACTINTAYAMGLENELGTISKGKKANVFITKEIPTVEYLPYYYGANKIESIILNGQIA
ncbi:MAG TPA: imidazolonepropionase [Bacteroidales bacterium]|nr:imidazolonepropionase [Bacteroidales bacterium]HRX96288.1 imidazolonepropionase [Bacteroidales bacterium]